MIGLLFNLYLISLCHVDTKIIILVPASKRDSYPVHVARVSS